MREIQNAMTHLQNKATGADGIPGELYRILYKHLGRSILHIANNITHGDEIPKQWTEGEIVHIRKKRKHSGMWKSPPNLDRANHLQNSVYIANKQTSKNTTPHDIHRAIWLQNRHIHH